MEGTACVVSVSTPVGLLAFVVVAWVWIGCKPCVRSGVPGVAVSTWTTVVLDVCCFDDSGPGVEEGVRLVSLQKVEQGVALSFKHEVHISKCCGDGPLVG